MTTKMKAIIAGIVVLVIAAGAAGYFMLRGGDTYCSVIPKRAILLGRMDAAKMVKDNDIKAKDLMAQAGLADENLETGVDFASPIYYYAEGQSQTFGVVARLDDADQLTKFITEQAKRHRTGEVEEARGLKWVQLSSYAMGVWDDDKVLIVSGRSTDDVRNLMAGYMKQDKKESVMDAPIFDEVCDAKEALCLVVDGEQVDALVEQMSEYEARQARMALSALHMRDIHVKFAFAMKDNLATLSADVLPQTDEARDFFDNVYKAYDEIDGDLIERGITNPTFWAGTNVDGEKLYDYLNTIPEMSSLLSLVGSQINVENIIKSLDGDMSVAIDVTHGKERNPDVLFYAETSDNDAISGVGDWRFLRFSEMKSGLWTAPLGYNSQVYVGTDRKGFFVTNKDELTAAASRTARGLGDLKGDIKKCVAYATLDLQHIAGLLRTDHSTEPLATTFSDELSTLDRLTFRAKPYHAELTFSLTKGNSLVKTIQQALLKAKTAKAPTTPTAPAEPEPDYDETALDEYGV